MNIFDKILHALDGHVWTEWVLHRACNGDEEYEERRCEICGTTQQRSSDGDFLEK